MDVAAERLADAVRRGETVGVFGDYDVDGACSAALMVTLLRELGCAVHAPTCRTGMTEGYGPNAPALQALVGARRDADRLRRLRHRGGRGAGLRCAAHADVIVLDHHKAEGPPPPILATVNPNRLD